MTPVHRPVARRGHGQAPSMLTHTYGFDYEARFMNHVHLCVSFRLLFFLFSVCLPLVGDLTYNYALPNYLSVNVR